MSLWVIGGLDPTGGAGVLRDRWTAAMLVPDLEVVTVISAHTEQGDGRPARSHPTEPSRLATALRGLGDARAIKLGLVPASCVDVVLEALAGLAVPCVLDPVLHASDGGDLGASVEGLRTLARAVELVTPNREEARALLGHAGPAQALAAVLAPAAVLVKDERAGLDTVCDRLVHGERTVAFERSRVHGPDPRGTGCALATAIACARACGDPLELACARAIAWLDRARVHTQLGPDGRAHLPRTGIAFD
ncbi:MAG: bifunctional hydroxymethylpyrimidine kinase/phosphomethylpyrimidine kinase [Deltaproteobacteria bacterium]|nr:bifunctional hydroxymethylpyrimidine kinase/phosphomethylpyrimidine kinase [Nannocystaceae bacterium]